MLEETGYEAEEFILWNATHPASKIDWVVYTFIAKGLKKVADLNLDGGEKIILKPVTFDEFLEISTSPIFSEKEVLPELFEAKMCLNKKEKLRKLFDPAL